MADWSELPKDLLEQIGAVLSVRIDIIRFRSVCSSWRSSVSYPQPHYLSIRIPADVTPVLSSGGSFHLSKRVIYNLTSSNNNGCGWIVKLQEDDVSHAYRLLNPLSHSRIRPLPSNFPNLMDLSHVIISELGHEYILRFVDRPPQYGLANDVYREKVVFNSAHDLLMTVHVSGKLVVFNLETSLWSIIPDMVNPYDDIIFYQGRFCAVDTSGRAVSVDSSLMVKEVAGSIFGGYRKYLIELDGELLLVDRYLIMGSDDYSQDQPELSAPNDVYNPDHPNYEIYVPNDDAYLNDITAHFKVFKLDPHDESWVEIKSLGDGMIFLGDSCSFSASASYFSGNNGNCIYFTDRCFQSDQAEDGSFKGHSIGVFNMEDASIGPLALHPARSQLFWPPPVWATQSSSDN